MGKAARRLAAAGFLLLAAAALAQSAQAYATPGLSGNLTLDSMGAPPSAVWKINATAYQVNETLTVSVGDTLQVGAGVLINFTNTTELVVLGGLEVLGNRANPVRLGVVPDAMSMAVAWGGVRAQGASPFVLKDAVFTDNIDIAYSNASGATLTNVTYQGRLLLDNATGAALSRLIMTITPTDVGRISLWIESSTYVVVDGADFVGGTGWGGSAVIIDDSADIALRNLILRVDSPNIIGVEVVASTRVALLNFTFTVGPMGGDPNQALEVDDSTDVLVDRLVIAQVPSAGVGAIYGLRSNATISNSTFDPALPQGVWQYPGTLTSVNATNLPVRPGLGGTVVEYELIRIEARWQAGGAVGDGTALIANDSYAAQSAVVAGFSSWMRALRLVNESGAVNVTSSYRADLLCNCSSGQAFFNLTDGPGITIVVAVGDDAPPVPVALPAAGRTGEPVTLDGSGSFDNAGVAAYLWSLAGTAAVAGLPCATSVCVITFDAPGNYSLRLNITDTAGLSRFTQLTVAVADITPPIVTILGVAPARPGQDESFQVTAEAEDNDPAFLPNVSWYLDGARIPGDTLQLSLSISTIGNHSLRVAVADDSGNTAEANTTLFVHDAQAPDLGAFSFPTDLVAPATVVLNGTVVVDNVGVTAWRWHLVGPGTDYNLTGRTPSATFPVGGAYNVTLTAEDAEGNRASRTIQIILAPKAIGATDPGLPLLLLVGLGSASAVIVASLFLRPPRKRDAKAKPEAKAAADPRTDKRRDGGEE